MRFAAVASYVGMAAALCLVSATGARAQVVIKTRPLHPIFHTSRTPEESKTQIDFTSFLSGGLESLTIDADRPGAIAFQNQDTYGNLVLNGRVNHEGKRKVFGFGGGAATSYYSQSGQGLAPFNLGSSGHYQQAFGQRWTFSTQGSFYYSPYYVFAPLDATAPVTAASADLPTDAVPESDVAETGPEAERLDARSTRLSTKGYTVGATLQKRFHHRSSFFFSYGARYVDSAAPAYDLWTQSPRGGYRVNFLRYAAFVASYGITVSQYRGSPYPNFGSHDINLGIAYNRPFSYWRKTTFGFNAGTALIRGGPSLRAYLNGSAHINHRFGRTWIGGLNYVRGQQVLENFSQPFYTFADTGSISVSGKPYRDVGVTGHFSYTRGTYHVGLFENVFDTKAASVRVFVPVMWMLGAYGEAFYSDYDFQRRLGLLEGVPMTNERFGVRAGVRVMVPVLR